MNRIKLLREEKGVFQKDLANLLGVSIPSINYYENEKRAMDTETASILAKYFNVSIDYLLGKSDIRNPEEIKIDVDKINIGLSAKDYENITDNQRRQIEEFAKFVLKDNLKNKGDK